jgi:hypothetical protein
MRIQIFVLLNASRCGKGSRLKCLSWARNILPILAHRKSERIGLQRAVPTYELKVLCDAEFLCYDRRGRSEYLISLRISLVWLESDLRHNDWLGLASMCPSVQ